MIEFIIKNTVGIFYLNISINIIHMTYYTIYLHYNIICLLHTYISKCVRNDVDT